MCWVLRWSLQIREDAFMSPTAIARWTKTCLYVLCVVLYLTAFAAMLRRAPHALVGNLQVALAHSLSGYHVLHPAQTHAQLINTCDRNRKLSCQIVAQTWVVNWAWHFSPKRAADVSRLKKMASAPLLVKVKVRDVVWPTTYGPKSMNWLSTSS